jgi:VanZ family protein
MIFFIAFDPTRVVDIQILPNSDKTKHIGAFFTLSYFLFESTIKIQNIYKILILGSLALIIEYVQSMIGREASINDFIASFFGVILFIFVKTIIKKLKNAYVLVKK